MRKYEGVRSYQGILLKQGMYVLQLISDLRLGTTKPVATPIDINKKFTLVEFDEHVGVARDEVLTNISAYQILIGRLIYLTIIRFGIIFIVQTFESIHAVT